MDVKGKVFLQVLLQLLKLRNGTKAYLEQNFFSIVKFKKLGFSAPLSVFLRFWKRQDVGLSAPKFFLGLVLSVQSHTMKSMKALQQSKKRTCLFHWVGHTALKRFKAIVLKTAVFIFLAMIKVIAIKLAKFLIAKSLKLGYMYLISIICMLLFACRIFSANNSN